MKVSVSLPDGDVAFLDSYADAQHLPSRSAAVQHAVRLLRGLELAPQYESAFLEWDAGDDGVAWDATTADDGR